MAAFIDIIGVLDNVVLPPSFTSRTRQWQGRCSSFHSLTYRGCIQSNCGHQFGDWVVIQILLLPCLHFLSCLSNPLPFFLNVPAGAGGWARWPPEVPSGLNHAVILKHCFAQLDTGLVVSFLHSYNKAGNININSSTDITKHMNADTAFSGNCLCQTKCFRCCISFGYE